MDIAILITLLVLGLFLVIAVLMQHGKSHGLSGTIAGAAETYLGKERGTKVDRMLARLTTIIGILFVVVVLVVYIMQPTYNQSFHHQSLWQDMGVSEHYGKNTQTLVTETEETTTEGQTESKTE